MISTSKTPSAHKLQELNRLSAHSKDYFKIQEFFNTDGSKLVYEGERKHHKVTELYCHYSYNLTVTHEKKSLRELKVDFYATKVKELYKDDTGAPLVFVLPQLFGTFVMEHALARRLAKRGINAVILDPAESCRGSKVKTIEALRERIQSDIKDLLVIIPHIAQQHGIDPQRLGIFGASMGALRGAMAASMLPQLKAVCLMEPTVHIGEAIATAKQCIVKKQRKALKKGLNIKSDKELCTRLKKELLPFDPASLYELGTEHRMVYTLVNPEDAVINSMRQQELAEHSSSFVNRTSELEGSHAAPVIRLAKKDSRESQLVLNFFKQHWTFSAAAEVFDENGIKVRVVTSHI